MAKYRLSREARDDIGEIVNYIAKENIDAAIALDESFNDCFEMLGKWRESGRDRPDVHVGLRSFPHRRYVIFYRLEQKSVIIIRVLHGSRDTESIFRADDEWND